MGPYTRGQGGSKWELPPAKRPSWVVVHVSRSQVGLQPKWGCCNRHSMMPLSPRAACQRGSTL
jgi:hypothetical protein